MYNKSNNRVFPRDHSSVTRCRLVRLKVGVVRILGETRDIGGGPSGLRVKARIDSNDR